MSELNRFFDTVLDGYLDELDKVLRKEREDVNPITIPVPDRAYSTSAPQSQS